MNNTSVRELNMQVQAESIFLQDLVSEINKVMVGQEALIERVLIALLADGHILLEGVPGLAKTLLIKTLAQAIHADYSRIQFTPDLLPADLVGTQIYNPRNHEFTVHQGPIFANLILADEINRAPAKVQSALLEAMQERQVTIGDVTYKMDDLFMVLATQNPIEQEGTYPLPEAQVDRFMLKVLVGYPNNTEEFVIVERMTGFLESVQKVLDPDNLLALQNQVDQVYADPALIEYAVKVVSSTREPRTVGLEDQERFIMFGVSPRASINLILTARALAFVRGRTYVLPQDVRDMVLDVCRHRLVLSYEALSENVSSDDILNQILDKIPLPAVPLHEYNAQRSNARPNFATA